MEHNLDLIMTLTGGLTVALIFGYATHRLGLSPIVGYLVSGFFLGPFSPGFVADQGIANQFAEVGVILLMFGVGLQFHLEELLRVRRIAIPGAVTQITVATILGCVLLHQLGSSWSSGLIFGLAISVASTVVLLRVLSDNNDLHTPSGHIAVGWLVVEDLFTILVLVMLPVMFGNTESSSMTASLIWSVVKLGILVVFTMVAGQRIVPWLLAHVAATRSRELFTLSVLVVALGIAYGAAKLFGASMALGAFLAGMVVGRSEFSLRAATDALPMRDAFAVLFFVSIGMLFDPTALIHSPAMVAATLGIVLIGKPLAAMVIILLLKYSMRTALIVGIALSQIGEFSFIVASLGEGLGLLDKMTTNALIAAAIVSISLNPLLYRLVDPLERWCLKHFPQLSRSNKAAQSSPVTGGDVEDEEHASRYTAILIGYGPVGRTVGRLLRENGLSPTVIELNLETCRRLRGEGMRAIYGDATHQNTLVEAGVTNAVALVLGAAGMRGASEIIRIAKELNPRIRVFARTGYLHEVGDLREAGADVVFSGEGEVALGMTEFILRQLGASPEQIDRERDRIREDLFGGLPLVSTTIATALRPISPETHYHFTSATATATAFTAASPMSVPESSQKADAS